MLIQDVGDVGSSANKCMEFVPPNALLAGEVWRVECAFPELERLKGRYRREPLYLPANELTGRLAPLIGVSFVVLSSSQRDRELGSLPCEDELSLDSMRARLRAAEVAARKEFLGRVSEDPEDVARDVRGRSFSYHAVLTFPPEEGSSSESATVETWAEDPNCGEVLMAAKVARPATPMFSGMWSRPATEGAAMWEIRATSTAGFRESALEMASRLTLWSNGHFSACVAIRERRGCSTSITHGEC